MAKKDSCKRAPQINGELSTLYLDLYDLLKKTYGLEPTVARRLTNVLYANYKAS